MGPLADVFLFTIDWRNRSQTRQLIGSLQALPATLWVIVNDPMPWDLGEDGIGPLRVREHRVGRNIGFAAACNVAIGLARAAGARFLMHLNNDIRVTDPRTMCDLICAIRDAQDFAAVSPVVLSENSRVEFAGSSLIARLSPALIISRRSIPPNQKGIIESLFFDGACFAVRRDVLEHLGGFDEAYFAYREEHDLAQRALRRGWRIGCFASMQVVHATSATAKQYPFLREFLLTRAQILYMKKNLGGVRFAVYFVIVLAKTLLKAAASLSRLDTGPCRAMTDAYLNQFASRSVTINVGGEHLNF